MTRFKNSNKFKIPASADAPNSQTIQMLAGRPGKIQINLNTSRILNRPTGLRASTKWAKKTPSRTTFRLTTY